MGFTPYPDEAEQTARRLKRKYKKLEQSEQIWGKGSSKEEMQWNHHIKLARDFDVVPHEPKIFHGWLHDSDFLSVNGHCFDEPKIEASKWEQYCFKYPSCLGDDLVFIEMHIDWRQWVDEVPSHCKSKAEKQHHLSLIASH